MVQERCLWPECEERGILAESGLQNAIYCHDLETPGVWYRGVLKAAEGSPEGAWMALNGPNSKNGIREGLSHQEITGRVGLSVG